MRVTVNGESLEFDEGLTVEGLLRLLEIEGPRVAVEVNQEVVRREQRAVHVLNEGNTIEIVKL